MKTKLTLLAISSSLVLAAPALLAQDTNNNGTNILNQTWKYQKANHPRIDAAEEAIRQARAAKDTAQIEAARKQLQAVWAGLLPYRETAVVHIRPLLTPDQLAILDDPKNQWRENHGQQANDPSAN